MTDAGVELAGEAVRLLPERALFWPRAATLVIADLHWGKAATLRAAGIPIPSGTTTDDIRRLDAALHRTRARRVVILGDLFHAAAGRAAPATLAVLRRWRDRRRDLEMLLVRGNHDRHAGDPPDELGIDCRDGPVALPPFVLQHAPAPSTEGYALSGHVHPGLTLLGRGLQRERLPCFVIEPDLAVLPAFGGLTGLGPVAPGPHTRCFVVADDEVIAVPSARC